MSVIVARGLLCPPAHFGYHITHRDGRGGCKLRGQAAGRRVGRTYPTSPSGRPGGRCVMSQGSAPPSVRLLAAAYIAAVCQSVRPIGTPEQIDRLNSELLAIGIDLAAVPSDARKGWDKQQALVPQLKAAAAEAVGFAVERGSVAQWIGEQWKAELMAYEERLFTGGRRITPLMLRDKGEVIPLLLRVGRAATAIDAAVSGKQSTGAKTPVQGEGLDLSDREAEVMKALLLLNAIGKRTRTSRSKVAKKVAPARKPSTFGHVISALVKRGFLESHTGNQGGIWLTPEGLTVARQL